MLGINPGPLTLRELLAMRDAREASEWDRTALIASILANANRDKKKKPQPFTMDYFNPYRQRRKAKRPAAPTDWKLLREAWGNALKHP